MTKMVEALPGRLFITTEMMQAFCPASPAEGLWASRRRRGAEQPRRDGMPDFIAKAMKAGALPHPAALGQWAACTGA